MHACGANGVDRFPGVMHAGLTVIDGTEALHVGSSFVNGYWNDGDQER